MSIWSWLGGPNPAPKILEKVCKSLGREHSGLQLDLTGNKDEHYPGGQFVDFGWYDEHRHNSGWFRYPEMTVFRRAGQEWIIGVGRAEGGYTMNGYNSDLRLLPLPEGSEKLQERAEAAFKKEGKFKSTLLVAESSQTFNKGRLYYPLPDSGDFYWTLDKMRWSKMAEEETLKDRLPVGYKTNSEFHYHDNKYVIEPSEKKENEKIMYPDNTVHLLVDVIKTLIDTQGASQKTEQTTTEKTSG